MFTFLSGLVDPFETNGVNTPSSNVRSFILNQMRPLRWVILLCVLGTMASAIIEVWLIYYVGHLINMLVAVPQADLWQKLGGELFLVAIVLLIIRPCLAFFDEALDDVAFRPNAVTMIRWQAHRHVMRQSVGWFRNEQSGRLATRVREIGVSATSTVYSIIHTLIHVITYFVFSLWLLASIDGRLTIPLIIWALLYGLHIAYAVPRFRDNYEQFEASKTELTSLLVDTYGSIETVKLFADQSKTDPDTVDKFRAARDGFVGVQRFEVIINVGMVFLSNVLLVGLVGYAIVLWQSGEALLGVVAAALTLATRISPMAGWMLDAIASIFGSIGATREALRSVAQPVDIVDPPNAPLLKLDGGAVRFEQISHHYGQKAGGLNGLSLQIGPGEKVALVGPSGAGKSTIVNLLMRHFTPEAGHIFIDGQDIAAVKQDSLRHQIASVAQDASLLHRSIGENISYGRYDISPSELELAARKAQAHDFIMSMKDKDGNAGYNAIVGERGVRLSGGQRQRISLARALLRNAPILILDEATSALDSEVEAEILQTLYDFMADKTVIAIAHRLSTIAHMDKIAVIDGGSVVEFGTHQELLALKGLYAKLWDRQAGGLLGRS